MSIETSALTYHMCRYTDPERSCGTIATYTLNESGPTSAGISRQSALGPAQEPTSAALTDPAKTPHKTNPTDQVGFKDVLDMINPLQHLPIIGWIYRDLTGDTIKPVPAMIGGALFGGGLGLISSAVEMAYQESQEQSSVPGTVAKSPEPGGAPLRPLAQTSENPFQTWGSEVRQLADATPHYRTFDREQTAGTIAVYA